MSSDSAGRARELARLALLLDQQRATHGEPPGSDELWDWMQGHCSETRADEILSHIAADEDLYEQWQELREAVGEIYDPHSGESLEAQTISPLSTGKTLTDDRNSGRFSRWIRRAGATLQVGYGAWPTGAFSYAALATLLIVLVQPQSLIDPWSDWRVPKSVNPQRTPLQMQQAIRSVLQGMGAQLNELGLEVVGPYGEPLPQVSTLCDSSDEACIVRAQLHRHLGATALSALIDCQAGGAVEQPHEALSELEELLAADSAIAPLVTPLRRWTDAARRDDQDAACAAISTLIARALDRL